jgi:hypothetical protein
MDKRVEVEISGVVECDDPETFYEEFIAFLESKGYTFGSCIADMKELRLID